MTVPGHDAVPRWLDRLVLVPAVAVTAVLLAGVPLALAGAFRPVPVAVVSLVVFAALSGPLARALPSGAVAPRSWVPALLAVAVAAGYTAWTATHVGQHLLVDGDPAVYAMTGEQLAARGTPYVDLHLALFGGAPGLDHLGPGYFQRGDTAYPQFFHGLPVLLAVGRWIGGQVLLLRVDALLAGIALVAIYAVAARLVGPWWALAATVAEALVLPQLYFARETFSELPSQLLVWAALLVLWTVVERPAERWALPRAALGGLLFAASTVVRIDAFSYLVWVGAALLLLAVAGRVGWRVLAAIGVGALVPVVVAVVDAKVGTPAYLRSVRGQLVGLAAALVALVLAALVCAHRPAVVGWIRSVWARWSRPVVGLLTAVVVAGAAVAWFVRPYVEVSRDIPAYSNATIAGLQRAEGVAVNVPRAYDEMTMRWLSWYVGGVVLAVAVVGVAWLGARLLRGRGVPAAAPVLALVAVSTAVYVWRPQVFPVQYWASRRFLPVTFPGLCLLAAWVGSRLWRARRRVRPGLVRAGRSVASLAVLGGLVGWPLALAVTGELARTYDGTLAVIRHTCASLGPHDAVVLVGDGPVTSGLLEPVRVMCGVPAMATSTQTTAAQLDAAVAAIRAAGRRPVLLSGLPDPSVGGAPVAGTFHLVVDRTVPTIGLSLTHRPDEVFPLRLRVFMATPGVGATL